jgi:osmotically-inducible protein OsmY
LLLAAGAVAGVLYWKGIIGDRQGTVADAINASVQGAGFDMVTVSVSRDWVATVTGSVVGQVKKDELLALVRQNPNIKGITETLTVHPGPEELEQQLADALAAHGLSNVSATVGADLVATLTGTVDDPALVTLAMDTARTVAGLKDVQSAVKLSVAARQTALNQALAQGGFDKVTAQVVDENTVNVAGNVYSQEDKDKLRQLVSATTGVATVNDTTQIVERPPLVTAASVEADINKALQKAHLGGIAAVVDDSLNATLVGTVSRAADREHALRVAHGIAAVKSVRAEIEVASAVAPPAPPSLAEQQAMAVNAIKGQWVGRIDTGLFGYALTLNITGGAIGQPVGTSIYGSSPKGMCGGTLTLAEINPSQQFVFTDILDRTSMLCPGGGTLKMQVSGDGKALFEWYRPKNPNKRYAKGAGERR